MTDIFLLRYPFIGSCVVLRARERVSSQRCAASCARSPVSGGYSEGETPLPFPNRAVKPLSADGTWPARAWESRSPPVFLSQPRQLSLVGLWSLTGLWRAGCARGQRRPPSLSVARIVWGGRLTKRGRWLATDISSAGADPANAVPVRLGVTGPSDRVRLGGRGRGPAGPAGLLRLAPVTPAVARCRS